MEEQSNITFRVIKQGIMANANFTVLVNGKSVGKINFKKELTLPFKKGMQRIQFKVGFMTTKELKVNVDGNDKIIEWIYGNNTEPYIVGEENTRIENTTDKLLNNEDYMYCSTCGTKISKESTFCNKCGNKIEQLCQTEKSKIQNSKLESNQVETTDNGKPDWTKIISGIVGLIIMVVGLWNIYGGNGVDGEYWFSDGSGYVKINKDINRIYFYDEYNSAKGTTSVKFTDNKTFVYSDGLLEYTGTINGKKLTVECENDKMGGYEATKK